MSRNSKLSKDFDVSSLRGDQLGYRSVYPSNHSDLDEARIVPINPEFQHEVDKILWYMRIK